MTPRFHGARRRVSDREYLDDWGSGKAIDAETPASQEQWERAENLCRILEKPLPKKDISTADMKIFLSGLSRAIEIRDIKKRTKHQTGRNGS